MEAGEAISKKDVEYKMIESEVGLPYLNDPTGKKLLAAVNADYPFLENEIQ